jgi:hypothetical protein
MLSQLLGLAYVHVSSITYEFLSFAAYMQVFEIRGRNLVCRKEYG